MINPCLCKSCRKTTVFSYEFTTDSKSSKLDVYKILSKKFGNTIPWPLLENIDTKMAVYYEDMSLDYSFNDLVTYVEERIYSHEYVLYLIFLLVPTIFLQLKKFCLNYLNQREGEKMPMVDFLSEEGERPPLSHTDTMKCLLEMKNIQNDSLMKMEDVLARTNVKLQYLLEKLVLIENYLMQSRISDTQNNMLFNLEEKFSTEIYKQIGELKLKHSKSVEELNHLSKSLEHTKDNMEELRWKMYYLIDSQTDIKKTINNIRSPNDSKYNSNVDDINLQFQPLEDTMVFYERKRTACNTLEDVHSVNADSVLCSSKELSSEKICDDDDNEESTRSKEESCMFRPQLALGWSKKDCEPKRNEEIHIRKLNEITDNSTMPVFPSKLIREVDEFEVTSVASGSDVSSKASQLSAKTEPGGQLAKPGTLEDSPLFKKQMVQNLINNTV